VDSRTRLESDDKGKIPVPARNPVLIISLIAITLLSYHGLSISHLQTDHVETQEEDRLIATFKAAPVLNRAPRHEGVLRSGGIAPRILDLGTK
jgi:hypothetical protein